MFKPWRRAFWDARRRPNALLGPVLDFALMRFARILLELVIRAVSHFPSLLVFRDGVESIFRS